MKNHFKRLISVTLLTALLPACSGGQNAIPNAPSRLAKPNFSGGGSSCPPWEVPLASRQSGRTQDARSMDSQCGDPGITDPIIGVIYGGPNPDDGCRGLRGPALIACNGGGDYSNEVSEQQGDPNGSCPQTDASQSISVGGTLGIVNKGGQQQVRSVADVNQVNGYSSIKIVAGNMLYVNLKSIGWIYKDNMGSYWFQYDQNAQWTYSFGAGVTVGEIVNASFGLNSPPGKDAVAIGPAPGNDVKGEVTIKCWTGGAGFRPTTLG